MMKVLSFFTAKGGTGKTTFNMLFASYLKYVQEKRVMVLDLDAPEYSLTCCRDRDIDYLNSNGLPCELDSFYPVEAVRDLSEQSIYDLADTIKGLRDQLDWLVLDFKGSFKQGDPVCTLAEEGVLDMIVMPVEIDPMIIASMKSLSTIFQDAGMDALLFFNRVHGKEKPGIYDAVEEWFTGHGCKVSPHRVKGNIAMKREQSGGTFFRSTVCFPQAAIQKNNPAIIDLFEQICAYEK